MRQCKFCHVQTAVCYMQAIADIITPPVGEHDVINFLVEHLRIDLQRLTASIGRSPDDAVLLVHLVLSNIVQQQVGGKYLPYATIYI